MRTATKKERAPALRDAAMRLLEIRGQFEKLAGASNRTCDLDGFRLSLFTSFGGGRELLRLPPEYNYCRALNGRPLVAQPDALLDIWHDGLKVASFEWQTGGPTSWRTFRPGEWEHQLLSLAAVAIACENLS